MPLHVKSRPDRPGTLQITGVIALADGRRIQVRRRAGSNKLQLAREEAAAIEAKILRDAYHGERRGSRGYAEALDSWLNAAPRARGEQERHARILRALGDVTLAEVNQDAVNKVRRLILKPDASPATILRGVISPIRTVLNYAALQGWCDVRRFVVPRQPAGRTNFLLPDQMERLVNAAAPHLKALLLFLADTGARMSEAIELPWQDVDLSAPRVNFLHTKQNRPRMGIALSPRTVAALASLPHRDGAVFRTQLGRPYADKGRQEGGHIKHGFRRAVERARLHTDLTPHDLRHTWATWHYAVHRDLLRLKIEGGWSSVDLVERYAHLMPEGSVDTITAFWGRLPEAANRQERQWKTRIAALPL